MATAGDECGICKQPMKAPHVLKCQHVFCVFCLSSIESDKKINRPTCSTETEIPRGLQVGHLPRHQARSHTAAQRFSVYLVTSWEVKHAVWSVAIDECSQFIYTATRDEVKPIKMYDYTGQYLGHRVADRSLGRAILAIDTKRGLILAAKMSYIVLFDREGMHAGTIHCPEFKRLGDIAYQHHNDRYVVGDIVGHSLYYIDPDTYKVVHTVPAEEARWMDGNICNFYLSASNAMGNTTLATLDKEKGLVKLYDGDGMFAKSYGSSGSGFSQFDCPECVCIDAKGRLIVSDLNNNRLVRLTPDVSEKYKEWQVMVNTAQFGLGSPRALDITDEGLAAMAFYNDPIDGPFHLAILSGLY